METWVTEFRFNRSIHETTISEIGRYIRTAYLQPAPYTHDPEARELLRSFLKTADLHFTADEDLGGETVRDSLGAIYDAMDIIDPARRKRWLVELLEASLLMASRLVDYRQETDPPPALTRSLQQFVQGLRGFALQHQVDVPVVSEVKWRDLVHKIQSDRTTITVAHKRWRDRVARTVQSPLLAIESMADELQKHRSRQTHDRYTLAKITELQSREIRTLSSLRQTLQDALGEVQLHRSVTHLFAGNSYALATSEINEVFSSQQSEKPHVVLLLQKRFELLGLHEMESVLLKAIKCYHKMGSIVNSGRPLREKCLIIIEQIIELFWMQKLSMNIRHGDVQVDKDKFKKCVRGLMKLGLISNPARTDVVDPPTAASLEFEERVREVENAANVANAENANMWRPSLMKLETMLREGHVTLDSIQLVYDAMLVPSYTPPAPLQDPVRGGADGGDAGSVLLVPKRSSVYAAVIQERSVLRGQLRELLKSDARLKTKAIMVDDETRVFVQVIMNPYLTQIMGQWTTALDDYLKPLTTDLDDSVVLESALTIAKDRAITNASPPRFDKVAASLSSNTLFILQIIKVFRLFVQIGAGFVAQKVFNESYMRKVFAEGRDPPPLTSMLFLMLSIDATAHLMLVILLVLSSFAFKTESNTYLVDDIFLSEVLAEFAMSSMVLIILGMIVADTLRRKRYFQYADQGQVVSAAYRTALLYICVINFVVPFSMLIS